VLAIVGPGPLQPANPGSAAASANVGAIASYLWQVFLPPLPFMEDLYVGSGFVPAWTVYVKRFWGSFGWTTIEFPSHVLYAIALVAAAGVALAIHAALHEWPAVRGRAGELAVLLAAFVSVALVGHIAFATENPTPNVAEHGRYLFPAIATVAVVAVGACYGFGRRIAPFAATALVAATMLLSAFAQLYVLTGYYAWPAPS
jgi:hypothetical protein